VGELTLSAWKTPIERLRSNINQALERWIAKVKRTRAEETEAWSPVLYDAMANGIELDETDDALIAYAVLPGLDRKDFTVEVTENRLVIRGAKRSSSSKHARGFSRFQETSASFAKAVSLPYEVDPDGGRAKYKNGVLTVTLPKTEQARKKRIKIAVA